MANLIYYGMLFFIHVTAPLFLVIYSVNDEKHQGVNGNIRSMLSSIHIHRNCTPYGYNIIRRTLSMAAGCRYTSIS